MNGSWALKSWIHLKEMLSRRSLSNATLLLLTLCLPINNNPSSILFLKRHYLSLFCFTFLGFLFRLWFWVRFQFFFWGFKSSSLFIYDYDSGWSSVQNIAFISCAQSKPWLVAFFSFMYLLLLLFYINVKRWHCFEHISVQQLISAPRNN